MAHSPITSGVLQRDGDAMISARLNLQPFVAYTTKTPNLHGGERIDLRLEAISGRCRHCFDQPGAKDRPTAIRCSSAANTLPRSDGAPEWGVRLAITSSIRPGNTNLRRV